MMVNIDELKRLDREATQGPWEFWTSCSFRRIGSASGKPVMEPIRCGSDGHPDLHFSQMKMDGYKGADGECMLLRNHLPAIIEELETLRAEVARLKAEAPIDKTTP